MANTKLDNAPNRFVWDASDIKIIKKGSTRADGTPVQQQDNTSPEGKKLLAEIDKQLGNQ